jgi:molecular chaperone GrpE (heat shock protein)
MNPKISELLDRIQQMELEIELEMKLKRAELQADFEETRVRFEREVLEQQRRLKTGVISYLLTANLMSVLTAPVIYALFVPILQQNRPCH